MYKTGFSIGIKPDPNINFVEWSNTFRMLPKESSIEPGKYRTSRTPYVEEILLELSPQSRTQEVVVIKPTQIGFSEAGNNFLFAIAHLYPGPCLFVQPTVELCIKHSKKKVAPSVRDMPCLKDIIKEPKSRKSGNTLLLKEFPGGSWTFTGSNSPAGARSDSIRYLVLDDYDGFDTNIGGEGDPGALFSKRTDAFGSRRKIYKNSTPTVKGVSHIDREYQESSQGLYNVPCPHCGEMQYLEFGGSDFDHGIKFKHNEAKEVTEIWYVCKFCKKRIEEYQKDKMMAGGKYVHKYPDRKKRGFKVNSLFSPLGWLSWQSVAEEFLKAKGSPELLQVWTNTRMAEAWEQKGDQPEWSLLKAREEPYKILTIPAGGKMVVISVDTQDNRLSVLVDAWGISEECWHIYWTEIYGNPDKPEVWKQLDLLINRQYERADGQLMSVVSVFVDSAGHNTQAVYNYCRMRQPRVSAIKGAVTPNKPVIGKPTLQDVSYLGVKIKNGIQLWPVGTDTAKNTIYSRLKLSEPGPGYIHFPIGLEDEFYLQLTAEKLQTRYVKGFPVSEWVKTRPRNEVLDLSVYSYAAAIRAGLAMLQPDYIIKKRPVVPRKEQKNKKGSLLDGAGFGKNLNMGII